MPLPRDLRHPHDSFFKETFGRAEVAADFLRNYLPPAVAAVLDLNSLEQLRETFIDPDLQEHFSDLLYQAPLQGGEAAYVYILFEHKSYPEPGVAFQLLRYMVRIWERSLRQSPDSPLMPIIPIVLYHGPTRWQIEPRFDALFNGPDSLRAFWPAFQFQLTDLSHFSDVQIRGAVFLHAALLWLRHIYDPRIHDQLPRMSQLLGALARQETGLEYVRTLLWYLAAAGERITEADIRQLAVSALSQEGEAIVATLAQRWLERGVEQGLEQGRQEGVQVARHTILAILRARFIPDEGELESVAQKLAQITDLQRLEALNLYALEAGSLAEYTQRLDG